MNLQRKNNIVIQPNSNQENIPPQKNTPNVNIPTNQTILASPANKREKTNFTAANMWAEMAERMQKLREGTHKLGIDKTEPEKKILATYEPKEITAIKKQELQVNYLQFLADFQQHRF